MLSEWSDTRSLGSMSHFSKFSMQSKIARRTAAAQNIEEVIEEEQVDSPAENPKH